MAEQEPGVFVAGGDTLIGAGLRRALEHQGARLLAEPEGLDLTRPDQVQDFFAQYRPTQVYLAAGRSGGIAANQRFPAELMLDNLRVACNVLDAARRHGVTRLLNLGSSCSYPRDCAQPMAPEALMTGPLEPTNEAYATAKLSAMVLVRACRQQYGAPFISAIPANAFGPGDDFSPEESHVIAALIRRMTEAKAAGLAQVEIWGSGTPRREFIYVDDLAEACLVAMARYDGDLPINLGAGSDLSIRELAQAVRTAVGYRGRLVFNPARPDGMPRKCLDASAILALGWRPRVPFPEALDRTCGWFLENGAAHG
jgi:GDP-L-fucose synthase